MKITIEINSFDELIKFKEFFNSIPCEKQGQNLLEDNGLSEFQKLFTVRTRNVLISYDIDNIYKLLELSAPELLKFNNFGMKQLREVVSVLARLGLNLKSDEQHP